MNDLDLRLERALHSGPDTPLPADRLRAIRSEGRRRRSRRRAVTVGGAALAVVLLGGVPVAVLGGQDASRPAPASPAPSVPTEASEAPDEVIEASPDLPEDLAALQERILTEIPGALRSSPTQVDVPDPRLADPDLQPPTSGYPRVDGALGLGVDHYATPSSFPPGAFPRWLLEDWIDFEDRARAGDAGLRALALGGVRVAAGEWRMGCEPFVAPRRCRPVVLTRSGLTYRPARPTGPGQVAVSRPDPYVRGGAPSLAIAIVRQEDVTSPQFVTSGGESVAGRVDTRLAPGRSILWAAVPGTIDVVVVDGEERG